MGRSAESMSSLVRSKLRFKNLRYAIRFIAHVHVFLSNSIRIPTISIQHDLNSGEYIYSIKMHLQTAYQ